MNRKTAHLSLSALAALTLIIMAVFPATPAAADGSVRISGNGSTLESWNSASFAFDVTQNEDGTSYGTMEYRYDNMGTTLYIEIDSVGVESNNAILGGFVRWVDGYHNNINEGTRLVFTIEDNGEGDAAFPDRISSVQVLSLAACEFIRPLAQTPIQGNIQMQ